MSRCRVSVAAAGMAPAAVASDPGHLPLLREEPVRNRLPAVLRALNGAIPLPAAA